MKCPRCEEGTIKKVNFKRDNKNGYICDFCATVWLDNENITAQNGHPYDAVNHGGFMEYSLEESEELDQEHRDIMYSDIR